MKTASGRNISPDNPGATRLGHAVRLKIAKFLPRNAVPIMCASIGRVGSTMVWQALGRSRAAAIFGFSGLSERLLVRGWVRELGSEEFPRGSIYKTHDFPYRLPATTSLKILFLYRRPSDSILSVIRCHDTKGRDWIERHFANLHAGGDYSALLLRDVLRIGEQIDAWSAVCNADVLGMRYETMWDHLSVLSKFVGFDVALPPREGRSFSDMNPDIIAQVRAYYHELDIKVSRLPDYFVAPIDLPKV